MYAIGPLRAAGNLHGSNSKNCCRGGFTFLVACRRRSLGGSSKWDSNSNQGTGLAGLASILLPWLLLSRIQAIVYWLDHILSSRAQAPQLATNNPEAAVWHGSC